MVIGRREVLVIGLEPPCPRCAYLTDLVQELVGELSIPCQVRHLCIESSEAQAVAKSKRLKLGTAKDVAQICGIAINWGEVSRLTGEVSIRAAEQASCRCDASPAGRWSPTLDELLRPCEQKAEEAGIMMTPILVIDGVVRHQGSVPDRARIAEWLIEAFGQQERRERRVIEILGSGCKNCDALYENLLTALESEGWSAEYDVRKNKDVNYFIKLGVFVTPAMVMDGKVLSMGKVLGPEQIKVLVQMERAAKEKVH